jgi:hypothetical protein
MFREKFFISGPIKIYIVESNVKLISVYEFVPYEQFFLGGKDSRCIGLTNLPPSYAYCLEILGASNSWKLLLSIRKSRENNCFFLFLRLSKGYSIN